MEIIVLGEDILWNDFACVPIQTQIVYEIVIFIAEKEPVLPVFLVLIDDLLFDLKGYRDYTLCPCQSSTGLSLHLHLDIILFICEGGTLHNGISRLVRGAFSLSSRDFLFLIVRVDIFGNVAFIEEEVGVSPLHGLELHHVVAHVHILSSKALRRDIIWIKVPHDVIIHLVPFVGLTLLTVLDEGVVMA